MQLTKENIINNVRKNTAGIYYIKNKLNNKYYIGLSINVYRRLLFHINKSKTAKYQHIHRAISKDGIENFEFDIIAYIIFDNKNIIKSKLDFLEKYYIKKFNCFGKNGYNATSGGDKGVLGLIQSKEVRQHLREVNLEKTHQKYNIECWCYNLNTKQYYRLNHIYEIDKLISGVRKSDVLKYMNDNTCNHIRNFIFANTKENLQIKINYLNNSRKNNIKNINYCYDKCYLSNDTKLKISKSKSKYIYHLYDLNNNLIQTYYIKEIIDNFSLRFANNIRRYPIDKYVQINEYIWCKKLIHFK